MAVRAEDLPPGEPVRRDGVRIIWKGKRISRFVFSSGRVVEFPEGEEPRLSEPPRA
ncbi:MAG TPA: hypothetical protein VFK80_08495 [Limnochordia bacterium]|nr:hypothetical protein [Limnochordia bacterium]